MKCNRCDNEAFLRVDEKTVLCADCYSIEARFIEALEVTPVPHPPGVSEADVATTSPATEASASHFFDDGIPEKLRRRA